MSILIAGATGLVGKHIAIALQRQTGRVRGLVRGGPSNPKANDLVEAGVHITTGDLRDASTLANACAGVDTVICTATTMPTGADDGLRRVDHDGVLALIDTAERAGVTKFVYTSYSGNIETDCPLRTAKRDCEGRLRESAMDVVILRPTYFMELWLGPHLGFDPLNGTIRVYGDGNGKVSYISALDVVEFAVATVLKSTGKETIIEMGGPEALSQLDAVRIFEATLGTTCRLDFVPVEALKQQHLSEDALQKTFAALTLEYASGDVIPGAAATAQQYGVALHSVTDYAKSVAVQGAGA
jgi:NADH dehydrogenase